MSRTSLSRRLPLVMAGVAAIAVLIAALVAWPLITSAADTTARSTLSRTADLTAELLSTWPTMAGASAGLRRCSPRSRSPPTWWARCRRSIRR